MKAKDEKQGYIVRDHYPTLDLLTTLIIFLPVIGALRLGFGFGISRWW